MSNKEYILDTTKTLFQTLANMGVTYEEVDLTFDIIENHITEVVKNLTLSGVNHQRELLGWMEEQGNFNIHNSLDIDEVIDGFAESKT